MNNLCEVCDEREAVRPKRAPTECERCYQRRYYQEHYQRDPIPAAQRRDPITYRGAHRRVREVRGRASEHACEMCGDVGGVHEWSYSPGDPWEQTGYVSQLNGNPTFVRWSPNPGAYESLCRFPCHAEKDTEYRRHVK